MSLGSEPTQTSIYQGDTAELYAQFYGDDDAPLVQASFSGVDFTIRKPDGTDESSAGTVNADGSCYYRFIDTSLEGQYKWTAQAELATGEKRTYLDEFYVEDPLADPPATRTSEIGHEVWMRLEDCFDSELGGPWLRDMTLAYFTPSKVELFIAEGLLLINQYPPTTNLDLSTFTTPVIDPDPVLAPGTYQADPDRHILVQATLIAVIKHLMRSYVEQPNLVSGNAVWQDRRDYLQRWQTILTMEQADFKFIVTLWKRQFLNLGKGALLTHSKAGRLYPTGWRARNSMRGYY